MLTKLHTVSFLEYFGRQRDDKSCQCGCKETIKYQKIIKERLLTVFQHVTELPVSHSAIRHTVKLHDFLDLCSAELRLFAGSQHEATDELVLRDDAAAKPVMIFEKLQGTDAILENGNPEFVKNLVHRWIS